MRRGGSSVLAARVRRGRWLALAAGILLAAASLAACGDEDGAPHGSLAVGLTEFDPALLTGARGRALRPRYARIYVLWSAVQPRRGMEPDWDARGTAGFAPRAQLRAARAVGAEPVATFYSTPPWAARPGGGCEPPRPNPNARAPRADALPEYSRMVRSFLEMARAEGVGVRWLSAWNEPNSGLFLAPQRAACEPGSPSGGAALYAPIARAMREALAAAPGRQDLLVGEASAPFEPRPLVSSVNEFVGGLPRDVLCAGDVWAQHQYAYDADGVAEVKPLLRAIGCAPRRIWVTETGAGARRPGAARSHAPARLRLACRDLHRMLRRWWRDPRVEAAFQYTLREDPNFPVGLAASADDRPYPTYALWRAWGARAEPADPPPPLPAACR